jgi:hypothetical protein
LLAPSLGPFETLFEVKDLFLATFFFLVACFDLPVVVCAGGFISNSGSSSLSLLVSHFDLLVSPDLPPVGFSSSKLPPGGHVSEASFSTDRPTDPLTTAELSVFTFLGLADSLFSEFCLFLSSAVFFFVTGFSSAVAASAFSFGFFSTWVFVSSTGSCFTFVFLSFLVFLVAALSSAAGSAAGSTEVVVFRLPSLLLDLSVLLFSFSLFSFSAVSSGFSCFITVLILLVSSLSWTVGPLSSASTFILSFLGVLSLDLVVVTLD